MKYSSVLILSYALAACSPATSDEQRVRELVANATGAAEARDVGEVLGLVGADYADTQGNTRGDLQLLLRAFFAAHPKLELVTSIDSLEFPVEGLARARVSVRGLDLDRFDAGGFVVLDVELRRAGSEWRVVRADRARER
jgi:hypothetical protein